MDLVNKPIGAEGSVELKLEGGNLVLSVSHTGHGGVVSLSAGLNSDYFLDKLAALIPGELDDTVLAILKGALKAK